MAAFLSKYQFSPLTLLDEPDFIRLATGAQKSGSALQPESGGNRGNAGSHPFPSP
jgi:hypothetical protein